MASKGVVFTLRHKSRCKTGKGYLNVDGGSMTMKELAEKLNSQFGASEYSLFTEEGQLPIALSPQLLELYGTNEIDEILLSDKPIEVLDTPFNKISVVVSSGSPDTAFTIQMCTADSVMILKHLIEHRINLPADEQVLTISGRGLGSTAPENMFTLAQSQITSNAMIQVTKRVSGGAANGKGKSFGMVDLFNNAAIRDVDFAPAPQWRRITRGLNLRGKCNKSSLQCVAGGRTVYSKHGLGVFSMDNVIGKCPMCKGKLDIAIPGFSTCFFKVRAVGTDYEAERIIHWTKVGHFYRTWDPEEAGFKQWKFMEIITRSSDRAMAVPNNKLVREAPLSNSCSICMRSMTVGRDVKMLSCTHSFHIRCHEAWLKNGGDKCSICSSSH